VKQLLLAVLFGLVLCTPLVRSQTFQKQASQSNQTSAFIQQGKVTQELQHDGLSIAHSSLPLNSQAKLTNLSTGKEIEVTIIRLIPAALGRIADVSANVWRELDLTPSTNVRISAGVPVRPQALPPPLVVAAAPPVVVDVVEQYTEPEIAAAPVSQVAAAQGPRTAVLQDLEPDDDDFFPAPRTAVTQTQMPRTTVTETPAPRTTVVTEPQAAVTAAPQTTTPRTTTTAAPRTTASAAQPAAASAQSAAAPAGLAGTGITSLGDMPGGIKFENNNNVIINGVPGLPSSETRSSAPSVTYQAPVSSQTQPAAIVDKWPQQTQPTVTYQPRPQPAQPSSAIVDTWPTQPVVTYQPPPQSPQPAAAFEMRPQQAAQPAVASATKPQQTQGVNDIWAQVARPTTLVETRTIPVQPYPSVNEVPAMASNTRVFIDAPAGAPKPSVTINNGTLTSMPPVPNETRPQQVQLPAASYVTAPANSNVRIENWSQQTSQPVVRNETRTPANQPIVNVINNDVRTSQQMLSNNAATLGNQPRPTASNVASTPGGQRISSNVAATQGVVTFETHTIEVPLNQAGAPMWNEIKPPSMNEIYSPAPNSRVFIDAPVDTLVPNVIINNSRGQ